MKSTRHITLNLLLLVAMLSFSGKAIGQEKHYVFPEYSEFSLVRNIDANNVLIYNNSSKGNVFFKVDINNPTTATEKILNDYHLLIKDFEIFEGIVYFCGVTNKTNPHAIFGYFSINNFPNDVVYMDTLPDMTSLNKMDVFAIQNEIHVVMTGTGANHPIDIVEAREITTNVWQYEMVKTSKYLVYDDVIATDNYVVFSARANYPAQPNTMPEYWFFDKPLYSGTSLFFSTSNVNVIRIYNVPGSPVFLSFRYGDKTESGYNSGLYGVSMDGFIGNTYDHSAFFHRDSTAAIVDLRRIFNGTRSLAAVVEPNPMSGYSEIWETSSSILSNTPHPRKVIGASLVSSIDNLPSGHQAVAVGQGVSDLSLHFHMMSYYTQGAECAPRLERTVFPKNYEKENVEIDIDLDASPSHIFVLNHSGGKVNTTKVCDQQ